MAWIELHQSVWTHRKTLALADALDIEDTYAAAHMARFWSWAMDNARNGDITVMSRTIIAKAAGWSGDPSKFVEAVTCAGFLDRDDQGLRIHNWADYTGRLMEARIKNKERQRRYRERNENVTVMSPLRNGEGKRNVTGLPYPTVPNPTVPEYIQTLRAISGWAEKGEPHIHNLLAWVKRKGFSEAELEASAIGLAKVQEKTLKGYSNLYAAFQDRLNKHYDSPQLGANNGKSQWDLTENPGKPRKVYKIPPGEPILGSKPPTML